MNKSLLNKEIDDSLNKFIKKGIINREIAENAILNIIPTTSYKEAISGADLVIESVPENLELKKRVFSNIDNYTNSKTILATNTSTLSITELGKETKRPENTVGMHWFIPPQLTHLIEIIKGEDTSNATINSIFEISKKLSVDFVQ